MIDTFIFWFRYIALLFPVAKVIGANFKYIIIKLFIGLTIFIWISDCNTFLQSQTTQTANLKYIKSKYTIVVYSDYLLYWNTATKKCNLFFYYVLNLKYSFVKWNVLHIFI